MRHAVLGAGGVGGLIAAVLANAGEQVTIIVRPEALEQTPRELSLQSSLGSLAVVVDRANAVTSPHDVLWITVKATQLTPALNSVPKDAQIGAVVPLLNGIDHIQLLRARFGQERVVPATIGVESERAGPGKFVHRSPFARLRASSAGKAVLDPAFQIFRKFGFDCAFIESEATLLWSKLVFIAPIALATTATGLTAGEVVAAPEWRARLESCAQEACAVAAACGANVDPVSLTKALLGLPSGMRSSMQKDVAAGKPPELDAIAGPILRRGAEHGISVTATAELAAMVRAKIGTKAY
jgi:2-dehydropantoate 2-reductase